MYRLFDAQPDGRHGAHGVPGGQAVRRPDGHAPRTVGTVFADRGPGHCATVAGPNARGRRGRRPRRGVRPDGAALRHAVGLLRRVRRQERRSGDDRRERRRTGHGRAQGTVAPRQSGRV